MPFHPEIWNRYLLSTTFEACRIVKAALLQGQHRADRLLRRIREAYYVEEIPIDDRENLLNLAREEGLDIEAIRENLSNGRAEILFGRDRQEAAPHRFGFPTLLLRKNPHDAAIVLRGMVQYGEVLQALYRLGLSSGDRKRFLGRPEDWDLAFSIHSRLTLAELRLLSGFSCEQLAQCCVQNHITQEGDFFIQGSKRLSGSGIRAGRFPPR